MIFVDTFYRKAHIQYKNDTVVEGITLNTYAHLLSERTQVRCRFTIYEADFFNASQLPENADYYQFGPAGVMNGTSFSQGTCLLQCRVAKTHTGLPLFLSKPHFLDADPYYLTLVNMSPPVADAHDTFVMIEPVDWFISASAFLIFFLSADERHHDEQLQTASNQYRHHCQPVPLPQFGQDLLPHMLGGRGADSFL
jgi:hypothetical protein